MIVYLIHNTVNKKYYVGWSTTDFTSRWNLHVWSAVKGNAPWHISRAIRKYGPEAFTYEILATVGTKKEAKHLEKLWIIILRSYDPEYGYNMTYGGDGVVWELIPEERQKEIIKKRTASLIVRGQNPTQAMLDRPSKVSKALTGRKGSLSPKKGLTDKEFYGEEKADEISERISTYMRGTRGTRGFWITNGVINHLCKGDIPDGFRRGKVHKTQKTPPSQTQETKDRRANSIHITCEKRKVEGKVPVYIVSEDTRKKLSEAAKLQWIKVREQKEKEEALIA